MAAIEVSIAAATAIVDYDLFTNVPGAEVLLGERVLFVALKGSAAAGDTRVRVMVGTTLVAWLYNNDTGAPNRNDLIPVGTKKRPIGRIYGIVTDAAATNPIYLLVVTDG